MKVQRLFPFLQWLPNYKKEWLPGDLLAGLTVGIMLVPQGMAYALIAGLPPIYGLYAGIVPLFLYAFFGTSRHLSVGPTALVSILVMAGVSKFAEPDSNEFISLAITTSLAAGAIQVLLGGFRLGFLIKFLSHPVISGFTSAAALIIGFSQLKNLMGIDMSGSFRVQDILGNFFQNIDEFHLPTFLIGALALVLMLILRYIKKTLPGALIAIVIGIAIVRVFEMHKIGVDIIGFIPKGLPDLIWPVTDAGNLWKLLPLAFTICLISFIESLAIAKTIDKMHKSYKISPSQELIALGITKLGGAFFQAYPTTGSFTRSAINNETGAKTGVSSIIAAALIALTLIFLTPLFYYLPKAVLAAIVVVAIIGLIDYREALRLWKTDKRDFLTLMATFIVTLTVGIQEGVLAGVILSLSMIIYQNSKPHFAVLGRLPGKTRYRNVERFPQAIQHNEVLIVRFDSQLYFGNAEYFMDTLEDIIEMNENDLKLLILDASSIHDIDSTGVHALNDVLAFLDLRNIEFYLTSAVGPVRDILKKTGLSERIGKQNQFLSIHDAMEYHENQQNGDNGDWSEDALQTNVK